VRVACWSAGSSTVPDMELPLQGQQDDLRSSRMPSAEGRGRARAAWDAYARMTNKLLDPVIGAPVEALAQRVGVAVTSDMVGFWLMWHLHGGFDGLLRMGMARTTIFRKVKRIRHLFGQHPDEFEFPGVTVDFGAYWAGAAEAEAKRKRLTTQE